MWIGPSIIKSLRVISDPIQIKIFQDSWQVQVFYISKGPIHNLIFCAKGETQLQTQLKFNWDWAQSFKSPSRLSSFANSLLLASLAPSILNPKPFYAAQLSNQNTIFFTYKCHRGWSILLFAQHFHVPIPSFILSNIIASSRVGTRCS